MSEKRKTDFSLNRLDDLFTSQSERENGLTPTIKDIPLEKLVPFPNHPFKVRDDEEMNKLVESVSENGVLVPAIVREKDNGDYEIISGHRRKFASEIAGKNTLRCIVSNLDNDAATVIMVDSNIQRENILPSEKAFAYKMKLDAMKHQGKSFSTSRHFGEKLLSIDKLAENSDDSARQIQRYIRLTYLIPELLQMVDDGKMKMLPAVEISFLDKECQQDLLEAIESECCTPSHAQAIRMHKMFNDGELNSDTILDIMCELKPNQQERLIIPHKTLEKYIPKSVVPEKRQDYVCKALEHYNKFLKSRAERDSR
ncbi:MAG: ParB/RepB/Spo0J family partition protein [Eubacterium coprostanoligenes]|uniref:ParB/RepB/Spo0J family partition protein n=1 Tax=Eubacterium coprostanoligenes TaxID=290054 RepID=UPI0024094D04|nr:ParB/RepB/Spo0J family partition protein [Eubacterium coprostanoligenes]MDD6665314.1 ParB/RepB/Spo0J family partition protein [Eubacterium coprostanoligenes]